MGDAGTPMDLPSPVDAELIPDPETLEPFFVPSVHLLAVNQEGICIVSREAVPTFSPALAVSAGLYLLLPPGPSAPTPRAVQGELEILEK
jgi:hypothetical protein